MPSVGWLTFLALLDSVIMFMYVCALVCGMWLAQNQAVLQMS